MEEEFGRPRARQIADHHVFAELGGTTANDALEVGVDPKAVWRAVCDEMDVPHDRRLGRDRPLRHGGSAVGI